MNVVTLNTFPRFNFETCSHTFNGCHTTAIDVCLSTDLMKLRRFLHTKRNMTEEKTESVLSTLTAGMTFDFNPAVSLNGVKSEQENVFI